ncbi:hypothetical protein CAEBREN_20481 [Caenorhabditis brenneri]|uniref:Yippee domain-containing protein n=1 Tax=Caenorhabditis brenneri TaxID=135651 RepID=G0N277_CAEBE|nr:hypothetical protein CAEBREN_20481 [Caenorhabditis brenneri]
MGLKFFENNGGDRMFYCAVCHVYLADRKALVSTSFTGITGQAFLFNRAYNVTYGSMAQRQMMTGYHYVRDVFCGGCEEHLGWMYEKAPEDKERYKEGSVILERLNIIETEAILKPAQMDHRVQPRFPPARNPRHIRNREEIIADVERMNAAVQLPADRRARVVQLLDRQPPGFQEFPLFQMGPNNTLPQLRIHDEAVLLRAIGDRHMEVLKRTLRRMNLAILRCVQGQNNRDLTEMGFKDETGRLYTEVSHLMDGEPYQTCMRSDRNLVEMFERMQAERERVRILIEENANNNEIQEIRLQRRPVEPVDPVVAEHRNRADLPRNERQRMAMLMENEDFQLMVRARMDDFRRNIELQRNPFEQEERDRRIRELENIVNVEDENENEDDDDD